MRIPSIRKKSRLGLPAMADRCPIIQGSLPIDAAVKHISKFPYLAFSVALSGEIGCHGQHTGHEYRGINGRQFASPSPTAGLDVNEMVVEAFISRSVRFGTLMAGMKKPKNRQSSLDRVRTRKQFSFYRYDINAEPHPHRRYA